MSTDKKVAFLVSEEGIEQIELTSPWKAVEQAGATPVLVSLKKGTVQGFNHLDKADTFDVDEVVTDVEVDDFAALVLPGGAGNADALRAEEDAVSFVKEFMGSGKPVAVICHAPWMLVEADVLKGKKLTSYASIKTDIKNAGGTWVDEEVVVDGNLITSREPGDLDAFNKAIVERL